MQTQDITLVTAIVGCVTGVGSLLLNLYKAFLEKPKLKFELNAPHINGFVPTRGSGRYKCDYVLAVVIRLMNTGRVPYPIKSVSVECGSLSKRLVSDYPISNWSITRRTNVTVHYFQDAKCLTIPVTIEPGEVIERVLIFPFADDLLEKSAVKLVFRSPTWKKSVRVPVMELTEENIEAYAKKHEEQLIRL